MMLLQVISVASDYDFFLFLENCLVNQGYCDLGVLIWDTVSSPGLSETKLPNCFLTFLLISTYTVAGFITANM